MATNPPITIGEIQDVPAPGSGVKSAWSQEITNRIVQRFATVAARDAAWPAATAGLGAMCITLDTFTIWTVRTGPKWVAVAGTELLYSQITAGVVVTATTPAGAQTVINPGNVNYDGSPILIEFNAPGQAPPNVVNGQIAVNLWDANTDLGFMSMVYTPTATAPQIPVRQTRKITPTPGAHNYNLRAWISPSGTGSVVAGPGTGTYAPAFLRITAA